MAKRTTAQETSKEIIADLSKKIYKPIYILTGDEPYYIDLISNHIADHVLDESEKAFNQTILYGKDTDIATVIETSRRFPMMANHQVVIVKEAQQIKKLEDLNFYLKMPQQSTILVICHKLSPGGKPTEKINKMFQAAGKIGILFQSKQLYEYQIPAWISDHVKSLGISISPHSTELLKDYLGNDLSKIINELDKLIITLPAGTKDIGTQHIEQNIGISKDFNRFELNSAIGLRNVVKANRIADVFAKNPRNNPFILTLSSLYQYFRKVFSYHFLTDKSKNAVAVGLGVNPFFVGEYARAAQIYGKAKCVQIFSLLREYDMRAKGLHNDSTDHGELLKELIFKIMH